MILVSSCLAGEKVRYDGQDQLQRQLKDLVDRKQAVTACPELLGGLSIPREPAEIIGGTGEDVLNGRAKVITISGKDVTAEYIDGAMKTLEICQKNKIHQVILKENSPSCGSQMIYDGSHTGNKKEGFGVTTALLRRYNIEVLSEGQWSVREVKK